MKDTIQMALADRVKTVRSAIRLKHSLAADREINEAIHKIQLEFFKRVQNNELPDAIDLKQIISGD